LAARLRFDERPTAETRVDVTVRCVIDHVPSGRTLPRKPSLTRRRGAIKVASMDASSRRSVRSPDSGRDRTTTATSALTRPTTASAVLTRDTIRLTSESPRDTGYGEIKE
jgi:hypothetical protein